MNQKNRWPEIYKFLFAFSVVYTVYCVARRDSRLPIAIACVIATALFYSMELRKNGKK